MKGEPTTQEQIEQALDRQCHASRAGKIIAYFSVDLQTQEGTREPSATVTMIPNEGYSEEMRAQFDFHLRGMLDVMKAAHQAAKGTTPTEKETAP